MPENEPKPDIEIEAPGVSYADLPWVARHAARLGQPDKGEEA